MAIPFSRIQITSGTSSASNINTNFQRIEDALQKAVSRENASPNAMNSTLDMNGNRIINLPSAISNTEPVTLGQLGGLVDPTISYQGFLSERITGTAGQTLITLSVYTYDTAKDSLWVFVNGVYQAPNQYSKTSTTSLTLSNPLQAGDVVDVLIFALATTAGITPSTSVQYARTAAEITAGVIPTNYFYEPGNVKRYGAVGDGVVDDTVAFQNAIASSSNCFAPDSTGYKITSLTISTPVEFVFGKSVYTFSTNPGINITAAGSGTNLVGSANKRTKFTTAATSNYSLIKLTTTSNVVVSGIWFFGSAIDTANPLDGIYVYQSNDSVITDNRFEGVNVGVRVLDDGVSGAGTNPLRNRIFNNHFYSCVGPNNGGYGVLNVRASETLISNNICSPGPFGRHAIYLSAGSNRCVVTSNEVTGSTLAAINSNTGTVSGDDVYKNTIVGNVITGPGTLNSISNGIGITGKFRDNVIADNVIDGAGNNGIQIQGASATVLPSNNIIKGNRITNSQNEGMAIYDSDGSIISGNLVSTSNVNNVATADVIIGTVTASAIDNVLVEGNIIRANPSASNSRHNITISSGTGVNNIVSMNMLLGSIRNAVNDVSGANLVYGTIGGLQTATNSATTRIDPRRGRIIKVTLSQNTTFDVDTNNYQGTQGMEITMIITQDATGGRTTSWSSAFTDVSWSDTGNTANKKSQISFVYDGVFWRQIGAQVPYHT